MLLKKLILFVQFTLIATLLLAQPWIIKMNWAAFDEYCLISDIEPKDELDSALIIFHFNRVNQLNEDSIHLLKSDEFVIRFFELPSFSKKRMIKIQRNGTQYELTEKIEGDNRPKLSHFNQDNLTAKEKRVLRTDLNSDYSQEVRNIYLKAGISDSLKFRYTQASVKLDSISVNKIQSIDFKGLSNLIPNENDFPNGVVVLDGTTWVLEFYHPVIGYHYISRYTITGERNFKNACNLLIELALMNIPDKSRSKTK